VHAALPAVAGAAVFLGSDGGAAGVFQADLAALVVLAAVAGFALAPGRRALLVLGLAAALAAALHGALAGDASGMHWLAWLALATGFAASGLAAVGRVAGAGRIAAGAVAAGVLWIAMSGLFWADRVGDALPAARRPGFRQAVLHLDLATACAYDAARLDRMHEAHVYATVPLAATLVGLPTARDTGALWLGVGWLAWLAAWALRPGRHREGADRDPA